MTSPADIDRILGPIGEPLTRADMVRLQTHVPARIELSDGRWVCATLEIVEADRYTLTLDLLDPLGRPVVEGDTLEEVFAEAHEAGELWLARQ